MTDTPTIASVAITSTSNETVLSGDNKTVYVAGLDGVLSAYDVETGDPKSSWW
jgi:hypothetical protein